MKQWALLTVAVYFLMLAVLIWPAMLLLASHDVSIAEILRDYTQPVFWIFAAIMVLGETLLLIVPVGLAQRRPKPRRRLLFPILTSTFFIGLLSFCAAICILLAIYGDSHDHEPFRTEQQGFIAMGGGILALWLFWGLVFFRFGRSTVSSALTQRLMRWLIGGSILELLVAVPSHIIVRQRHDCCAPAVTSLGISTGIAVMLMSFGPGVFFLYAARIERLRGQHLCRVCGYDLRATPDRCPECGTPTPKASALPSPLKPIP